jgi:hypothetical protein
MRSRARPITTAAALVCAAFVLLAHAPAQRIDLGEPREVAPGVLLYHVTDSGLLEPAAPVSVWLLQLDPVLVDLRSALANDEIVGTETVADTAERHKALAAVNAGFFAPNGDPAGILKVDGLLVSDTRRPRGAVGVVPDASGLRLIFDRLRATAALVVHDNRGRASRVQIDGVDTARLRGRLMLFTPAYHANTDTAIGGLEWTVEGSPPRIIAGPRTKGRTPIPREGFVLSFGGHKAARPLTRLKRGTRVTLDISYDPLDGPLDLWPLARDIVGGAGLLIRGGVDVEDHSVEELAPGFVENRHPRTMIGTSADGTIWLVVVDGRQPELSVGMTLDELHTLAKRLWLTNALNLDGGGSTTMWVNGRVVNSPSDPTGPRKVSDALLIYSRAAIESGQIH